MHVFLKYSVLIGIAFLPCFIAKSYRESLPSSYPYKASTSTKYSALAQFARAYNSNKKLRSSCSDLEKLSTKPIHDISTNKGALEHIRTVAWIHGLDSKAYQTLINGIAHLNGSFSNLIESYNDQTVAMLVFHGSKKGCQGRHKKSQF